MYVEQACPWAARYNTWLLSNLMPKGVVCSFLSRAGMHICIYIYIYVYTCIAVSNVLCVLVVGLHVGLSPGLSLTVSDCAG